MKLKKSNLIANILIPILTILGIVLVWFFASWVVGSEIVLPSPIDTLKELFVLMGSGKFWLGLGGTILRGVIAFAVSFVLATTLALVSYKYKWSRTTIGLLIAILRALPTVAIILLLLLWTTSRIAAVVVTMIVVLPTLYSAIMQTFIGIDIDIVEMLNFYKVPKKIQFSKYIVPTITPSMIETIGGGMALNIKLMVAAEVIAGTARSIGQLMNQAKVYFETANLFALVIIVIVLAVAIELICRLIANRIRVKHGTKKDN